MPEQRAMEGLVSAIGPILDMFRQGMQDTFSEGGIPITESGGLWCRR